MIRAHLLIATGILSLVSTTAVAATAMPWRKLTASAKVEAIISRASRDEGQNVGQECKPWVQAVVSDATGGAVKVPSTTDGGSGSAWQEGAGVAGACIPVGNIRRGQIIQMRWRNRNGTVYPHTAIVLRNTGGTLTIIDANWKGDRVVRTHSWSVSEFSQAVGNAYSVYTIL